MLKFGGLIFAPGELFIGVASDPTTVEWEGSVLLKKGTVDPEGCNQDVRMPKPIQRQQQKK